MLIDYALLGNYVFLMLAFLWEAGSFDSWFSSSSADATDTETDTPEEDPEGPEFIGTDFLDLISGQMRQTVLLRRLKKQTSPIS